MLHTVYGKILAGEKLQNFLANIHRSMENIYGICTDVCLFVKFFLAYSFYVSAWFAKIFLRQIFPVYVTARTAKYLKFKFEILNTSRVMITQGN